jgi:hypothetical protein
MATATPELAAESAGEAPTTAPTAEPVPAPFPEHYWLSRPIALPGDQEASRYYPYGTTARGTYLLHHGVDLVNQMGTPVLAVADGQVVYAGDDHSTAFGLTRDFYGLLVIVQLDRELDGQPIYTLFGHLSEIAVEPGEWVARGDRVGAVGMSGIAMGPHLHFEVRLGENDYGATRNPELWLRPFEGLGTIAGRALAADGAPIPELLITIHAAEDRDQRLGETFTYPNKAVNSDDGWAENFLFADLPAGEYVLTAQIDGRYYFPTVKVEAGKTTTVEIRAP